MTHDRSAFTDYRSYDSYVHMGTSEQAFIAGMGTIIFHLQDGGVRSCNTSTTVQLSNVLHIPSFQCQLLSVTKLISLRVHVSFNNTGCTLQSGTSPIGSGTRHGDLFYLDTVLTTHAPLQSSVPSTLATLPPPSPTSTSSLSLWHERFANVDPTSMKAMISNHVVLRAALSRPILSVRCNRCLQGKSTHLPFPVSSSTPSVLVHIFYCDVSGPINFHSLGGYRYFVTFRDDHSKWNAVFSAPSQIRCILHLQKLSSSS